MKELTPRERVLRTIRHEPTDRMPITLDVGASAGIDSSYIDIFRGKTGCDDPAEFFGYDIRFVPAPLKATGSGFERYYDDIPPGTTFDEFGVGHAPAAGFPLGIDLHPWARFTRVSEVEEYPMPVFSLERDTIEGIDRLHANGYAVSVAAGSINEWCYYLRGMDNFMMDLALRPEMATAILERVTGLCGDMAGRLAGAGSDVICLYGDMGSQTSLLIGPGMWSDWIKPRWRTILAAARAENPEIACFYHSCGFMEPIIPGLVDVGFDILNPVQPESMNPVRVKHRYGSQLCLWGGIGMQTTMLGCSAEEVRQTVRRLVEAWAPGSGAIVTAAQTMLPDVPWENIVALVEAVREHSARMCQA